MELLKNLLIILLVLVGICIALLPLVTTLVLLYYVMQLEKETCDCIKDWRHNFLKYMLFGIIILSVLNGALLNFNIIGTQVHKTLYVMTVLVGVINTYSYFTYVTDLNETKCNCLKDMPKINEFLSVMKWVFVGLIGLNVFVVVPWYLNKDLRVKK